ncbi:hypothetical protein C1T17_01220 [Sphingobium sp. SCG-1]|uniref:DUF5818 domain-containing protein n=1 Tax=Sphingobium sp. SCG-1 TaxID=2072936 RepID=UPI000CD68FDD|nr:DUF5818 domain-containing protein [Sphingobium sp. SCG-1]AUW56896.1 hypothetical protein C1T17_01220 [Sphingobium sp. SCG-1]
MTEAARSSPDVITETGRLIRDEGGFLLQRDRGGQWRLILHRVPVDLVEKHVRVQGVLAADNVLEADGVAAA